MAGGWNVWVWLSEGGYSWTAASLLLCSLNIGAHEDYSSCHV